MNNFHFSVACLMSRVSQIGHQTRKSYVYIGAKIPVLLLYTGATSIEFNENENSMEQDFAACFEDKTTFDLIFSLLFSTLLHSGVTLTESS